MEYYACRTLLEKVQSRKYRSTHQVFVAEGHRIIREALQHGATPEALYFSRLKLVAALRPSPSKLTLQDVHALSDLPLFRAPYKTLQTWSSVTTSPGIVGQYSHTSLVTSKCWSYDYCTCIIFSIYLLCRCHSCLSRNKIWCWFLNDYDFSGSFNLFLSEIYHSLMAVPFMMSVDPC